jgi:hypothetical protein
LAFASSNSAKKAFGNVFGVFFVLLPCAARTSRSAVRMLYFSVENFRLCGKLCYWLDTPFAISGSIDLPL